jgi:hypothetical protein
MAYLNQPAIRYSGRVRGKGSKETMGEEVTITKSDNPTISVDQGLVSEFAELGGKVSIHEEARDGSPDEAEWAPLAGIGLWLTKPVFTAFMEKLGDAAGGAAIESIKRQFKNSKAANERCVPEGETVSVANGAHEARPARAGKQTKKPGIPIAPMEMNVLFENYEGRAVAFRFVLPSRLKPTDVEKALLELAGNQDHILGEVFAESPKPARKRTRAKNVIPVRMDAVYSPSRKRWESVPTLQSELEKGNKL